MFKIITRRGQKRRREGLAGRKVASFDLADAKRPAHASERFAMR
jgi:hypothetical protein